MINIYIERLQLSSVNTIDIIIRASVRAVINNYNNNDIQLILKY